jgi:hypothetical protein
LTQHWAILRGADGGEGCEVGNGSFCCTARNPVCVLLPHPGIWRGMLRLLLDRTDHQDHL